MKQCLRCGKEIAGRGPRKYCLPCSKEIHKEQQKERKQKQK